MLQLRKGGQFADDQINRYFHQFAIYLAVACGGLLVGLYLKLPLVGLLIFVLAFTAFKSPFKRWDNWVVGKRGELSVTAALESLSNQYALLNDLTLPQNGGNIDHLIVAPDGLYVIETKNYAGRVKCLGDQWYVNGRPIKSLSKQAKRNAMAMRDTLAPIFRDHEIVMPSVRSILVFANRRGWLNLKNPTIPVLRSGDLVAFIEKNARAAENRKDRADPARIAELKRAIVHRLHELQQRS